MLKKCGCAIYVHSQLDLLKFYLAILYSCPSVSFFDKCVCVYVYLCGHGLENITIPQVHTESTGD